MSGTASGSFAKTLVFAQNKGRSIVRQLVTPSNPDTTAQRAVRGKLAVAAAIQYHINRDSSLLPGKASPDEVLFRAVAPSGVTWNANVTKLVVGQGGTNYAAAGTAWAAATQSAWETAAAALTPAYVPVVYKDPDMSGFVTITIGELYFRHMYAAFSAGIITNAPSTPPTRT